MICTEITISEYVEKIICKWGAIVSSPLRYVEPAVGIGIH